MFLDLKLRIFPSKHFLLKKTNKSLTEDTPLLVLTPSIFVTPLYIVVTSIKYHAIFVILLDVPKGIEKDDQKVIKLTSQVAQKAPKKNENINYIAHY